MITRSPHSLPPTFDPELTPGARNAIRVCLNVQPHERVTLVTDQATLEIASSLYQELREVEARCHVFVLEDLAARPLRQMPTVVLEDLASSTVAIGCLQPQEHEIESRRQLIEAVEAYHLRYAHMVWITPQIMRQAMRADYHAIDALSDRVLARTRPATSVTVKSPAGTDIRATFREDWTWVKTSGLINTTYWSNLPAGEVFTTPVSVDGVFVVDGTVGDYLCPKYGDLRETPLTLEIEAGHLRDARCRRPDLLAEFTAYCHTTRNSDRVGEFALGTNIGITSMIGNLLQDEKVPGVHIAFGNPYGSQTGADWTCPTHIDAITRHCNVWAGGDQIMADGRFLV